METYFGESFMSSAVQPTRASSGSLWAGRIISALAVLMMLFFGSVKLFKSPSVVQGFAQFGFPESLIVVVGVLEVACTLIYLVPRTAVLGAILMTGLLGGATATNVRVGNPYWFAPVIVGVLAWAGLLLRDDRVRDLFRSSPQAQLSSRKMLWTGRVLSALTILFILFDGAIHLTKIAPVVNAFAQLGFPLRLAIMIGIIELACVVVYAIPRASVLGAILLTAYLGGAVVIQLRVGNPLFSETLFPVYLGLLLWGGLFLRDARLRALIPLRNTIS